jgi:WD40 repeat protein
MVTVTYDADKDCFYSGTGNGAIYEWKGNSCVKAVKVHEGAVKCLHWSNGKLLSSGSRDHLLKVSKDGAILHEITLPSSARSLDYYHNQYLVATSCGKILTVHEESLKPTQIMQGHWTGETWGLAVSPDGIFTTADDNQVLHFNPTTKRVESVGIINEKAGKKQRIGGASTLSMVGPNQQSRAVAVNSLGHVALGVNEGTLTIRTTKDLNMKLFEEKIAR